MSEFEGVFADQRSVKAPTTFVEELFPISPFLPFRPVSTAPVVKRIKIPLEMTEPEAAKEQPPTQVSLVPDGESKLELCLDPVLKGDVDVIFVGDTLRPEDYGSPEDMLGKMIQAMKLPGQIGRLFYDDSFEKEEYAIALKASLNQLAPKYVIPMGATSTHILLNDRRPLSKTHGRAVGVKLGDKMIQVIPIFHPEYLKINPNMKRLVWNDLQQVILAFNPA